MSSNVCLAVVEARTQKAGKRSYLPAAFASHHQQQQAATSARAPAISAAAHHTRAFAGRPGGLNTVCAAPHDRYRNVIVPCAIAAVHKALGGEPLNGIKRLRELKHMNNKTRLFTLYGVTEMSCWACVAELDLNKIATDREVPLGSCLSETEINIDTGKSTDHTGKIILVSNTRKCYILNKSGTNGEECALKFVDTGDIGEKNLQC
ncbi:unnamed protein product, partial [Iphiclides podalirius]